MSAQSSFITKQEKSREILSRASNQGLTNDTLILAVSGGLDSAVAATVMCELGPEYGFDPDVITHINTGAGVPQTQLVAKKLAERYDLEFVQQGHRNRRDSLGVRVVNNGWPGNFAGSPMTGGHGLEWANRKDKPMNAVYMMFDGDQVWISGVRVLESSKRKANIADSAIEQDKPRRTWVSPIMGWTEEEKREYVLEHDIPVSEAYLILGFSAECVACAYDNTDLLMNIEILCPELSFALRTLAVWLYMRVRAGEVEIAPKRLCWGWEPDETKQIQEKTETTTQEFVGCSAGSCATKKAPEWVLELDESQIVTRADVLEEWNDD